MLGRRGLVYALLTWSGPHRLPIALVGAFALVTCPLIVSPSVSRRLTGPQREPYLYAWSASLLLAVAGVGACSTAAPRRRCTLLFAASLVFTASGFGRPGVAGDGRRPPSALYLVTCVPGRPRPWMIVLDVHRPRDHRRHLRPHAGPAALSLENQQQLTDAADWQAPHDGLTGCLNHRALRRARSSDEVASAAPRAARPWAW